MKKIIILIILLSSFTISSQEKNIFLDRDFWKSKPTVKTIKKKIKEGHNPTEQNQFSFDAVSYALIDDAPIEGIKYLLTLKGNPVTKPTHGGVTYLSWAAYKGNKEAMKYLIKIGADPKISTSRGTNLLLMAAVGGVEDKAVYDLILSKGIDVNYKSDDGANALLVLSGSEVKDLSIFNYLIDKGISLKSADEDGNNLFNYAARGGNIDIMKMWVDKGVPYNVINKKGENAVLIAAQGMKRRALSKEVFSYLKNDLKLETDIVSWEGKTPLHYAVRRADADVVNFFINEGVSLNQIDENGNIALMNAIGKDVDKLKLVAENTSNVNHVNNESNNALTKAIRWRSKESFDYLLANGVNPLIVDKDGNTLLFHAFNSYRKSSNDTFMHFINMLREKGVNPKNTLASGNTLAHIAIEKESLELLEKAIEMGVNINVKNDLDLSPLHLAAMKAKNNNLIEILLKHGANKELKTDLNESAYDLASQNELLNKNKVDYTVLKIE